MGALASRGVLLTFGFSSAGDTGSFEEFTVQGEQIKRNSATASCKTIRKIQTACSDDAMDITQIKVENNWFKDSCTLSDWPSTSQNDQVIVKVNMRTIV
ncbi:hypothetical protein LAZ67_7003626 [Cordylochernes scorpioides]|uniref:Uncharacterized protein n=1 Tax=Cordylochernes scorpioides TaxID=51811 RepID=A0ABY6KQY6_9ARAC|nr:hypothetical protein LAZ67_7003626 [Cordylochernes scorpioides]